ncbi:MAG: radical SAM protein, partial [Candidatus Nitrosotenuis sp.]
VMYKTWQHNFKYGIQKFMTKTGTRQTSVQKQFFNLLARSLGGVPLAAMEKYARKKGKEHEQVIEKVKAKYW